MTVSDYVIKFIADLNIKHVFLVPGGGSMFLNASLAKEKRIEAVCNSHEQASAMAAEAYGKVYGLGVCMVTTGPGATNAITGVVGAWLDSTPVIFISGQVKKADLKGSLGVRQLGLQEVDVISMVKGVTKYAVTVLDPKEILWILNNALSMAMRNRQGPVWIEIPLDVQGMEVDERDLKKYKTIFSPFTQFNEVPRIIEKLNQAKRPLILVGNGARGYEERLGRFLDLVKIPVEATWMARDLVTKDSVFMGSPGALAGRGANFALQNCDFLLILGARMDFSITGFAPQNLARKAFKVMVDVDREEITKISQFIDLRVDGYVGEFLCGFLNKRQLIEIVNREEWIEQCKKWKSKYPIITNEHRKDKGLVSVYYLAEIISFEIEKEDILVSGSSGNGIEIFLHAFPGRKRIIHTAGLGAMGNGVPAAIGACLASRRKRTICIDGDGGFQFNIQELETIKRLNLPIKFFVLNNKGFSSIRASQQNFFGEALIGCSEKTGMTIPSIRKIANAYGIEYFIVNSQWDLRSNVNKVLRIPGPVVCEVMCIPDEVRAPRISSTKLPDGTMVSSALEDLWPFLSPEELEENMLEEKE